MKIGPNEANERDAGRTMMPGVSVVIIACDEAAEIADCLASVEWADEVVLVDSGSRDDTVAIARSCGARVIDAPWSGFGPQKNRGLAACTQPWVLSLDADERVTPALRDEIRRALTDRPAAEVAGFEAPRRSQFCGTWVRHSGWSPDYVLRLFRRELGRFSDDLVHERVVVQGGVERLAAHFLHYSYRTREEVADKTARYAAAGASMLRDRGRRAAWYAPPVHSGFAFLRTFIFRLGLLDGATGFAIATMNARVNWTKYRLLRTAGRVAPKAGGHGGA